jgi:hypothetical protein
MGIIHQLAHSIRLRHRIESHILKPVRTWKKLTSAASFDQEIHREAHRDAAVYAYTHFPAALYFQSKRSLYDWLLSVLKKQDGLLMECGVYKADSLNYFAKRLPNRNWHGFDSFEGLPQDWAGGGMGQGAFSLKGKLPAVRKNVVLHCGWFEHTVLPFLKSGNEKLAFVHLDADIYDSTFTVLKAISPYLQKGSLLLFDEYFGQIGWREGEHKAFTEWLAEHPNLKTSCLAFSASGAVLIEISEL